MEKIEIVIPEIKVNIDGIKLEEELEQPTKHSESEGHGSELLGDPDEVAKKVNDF